MSDRDYILGTEAEEIARLGLQHRVWRARMLDGWARAGIEPGMKVIDVGAGPGLAATDLAELGVADRRVTALERSDRFAAALRDRAARLGLGTIEIREQDVAETGFGEGIADA